MADHEQVQQGIRRLVQRYPSLFRVLLHWFEEPTLHGTLELQRHGPPKVTFAVTRKYQESGDGRGNADMVDKSPVRVL